MADKCNQCDAPYLVELCACATPICMDCAKARCRICDILLCFYCAERAPSGCNWHYHCPRCLHLENSTSDVMMRINKTMPDKKLFFVYNNSTSNSIAVDLTQDLQLNKLTLIQYQIDGVPVTGGVPDSLFYNLNFTNTSCSMNNPSETTV
jgi:hypothetical protein